MNKEQLYESCMRASRDSATTEFCANAEDIFNLNCVIAAKAYYSTTIGLNDFSARGLTLLDKLEGDARYL